MITKNLLVSSALLLILILTNTAVSANELGADVFDRRMLDDGGPMPKSKGISWTSIFLGYFIIQAIIGIWMFEWAYKSTRRFRE